MGKEQRPTKTTDWLANLRQDLRERHLKPFMPGRANGDQPTTPVIKVRFDNECAAATAQFDLSRAGMQTLDNWDEARDLYTPRWRRKGGAALLLTLWAAVVTVPTSQYFVGVLTKFPSGEMRPSEPLMRRRALRSKEEAKTWLPAQPAKLLSVAGDWNTEWDEAPRATTGVSGNCAPRRIQAFRDSSTRQRRGQQLGFCLTSTRCPFL